ncbi:MAG TPA: response regulator [Chthoniobacterales bacterium]|nr:response regulator [Chthoniobacterales bacterium]
MPTAVHSWKPSSKSDAKVCAFEQTSVCLLDDDLSMLKALERLLKSDGFNVERFSEPAAFLAAVGNSPCRVAILDVWMPDMNGLEVQAALRKQSPETRIIFISGRDDPSVRQTALEAGAFGFLSKPFDDEVFLQLVRKAVAA